MPVQSQKSTYLQHNFSEYDKLSKAGFLSVKLLQSLDVMLILSSPICMKMGLNKSHFKLKVL